MLTALMRRERVDAGRLKHRSRDQSPGRSGEGAGVIILSCPRGRPRGWGRCGEVGEDAFGGHGEGGGDQFGVEVVDQVDQSGGAEPFGRTLAGPSTWLKK